MRFVKEWTSARSSLFVTRERHSFVKGGRGVAGNVCCEVGAIGSSIAMRAAEWAQAFHPSVSIRLEGKYAHLSSAEHSEDQLRAIWLSSLANERLHARAATWRAAALMALMQ
jgi:hypothetical protein